MSNNTMAGIPGMGAMTDTLEFVKNMWGGMNLPGMVVKSEGDSPIGKTTTTLLSAKVEPVPDSEFEIPKGYDVREMPAMTPARTQ